MIPHVLLSSFVLMMAAIGCGPVHDQVDGTSVSQNRNLALKTALAQPETIDFSQVEELVLKDRCVECHNPRDKKDNLDLSSYEVIFSLESQRQTVVPFDPGNSSLVGSVTVPSGRRHMPPADKPQLTQDQIRLVQLWVEHGAKQLAIDTPKKPPTLKEQLQPYFSQPETIDYTTVQNYIFKNQCIKCHSKDFPDVDRDILRYNANLTNYRTIFHPALPVVVKGVPNESKIYKSVSHFQSMPPEKEGYEPLSKWQIKLLRLWILNCAVENHQNVEDDRRNNDPKNPEKVRLCENQ